MVSAMQRQSGYYWVKDEGKWSIAFYHDNNGGDDPDWCWRRHNKTGKVYDEWFSAINETRILNPDEKDAAIPSINGFDLLDTVLRNAQRTGVDIL